jgi:glutamyl/glutaminyl-tRNA synthetase
MQYTTRFCPTINGFLHLGHAFACLINRAEAHRSGGRFGIRFDDTQRAWLWTCGADNIKRYHDGMIEDLEWLGIKPDWWSSQSELMPRVEAFCKFLHYDLPPDTFGDYDPAEAAGVHHCYPPNKRLTIEHVVMDFLEGCNFVIRGNDLLPEDCLYDVIRREMQLPPVKRYYLDRLYFDGDEISKTLGKFKICDFRKAGMKAQDLISDLSGDCLKYDLGDWTIDNIQAKPTLGAWARKALNPPTIANIPITDWVESLRMQGLI